MPLSASACFKTRDMTMSVSLDASEVEARGKVVEFTGTPSAASKSWSGIRKYWLAATVVSVIVVAGVAIWLWAIVTKSSVQYVTAPVTRGMVTLSVTATGTVNPELTIIVGSYVSGVIQSLSCDYNTEVKAGQSCAKIDPRPYQTVVNQDRANLANAKAQLSKDQATLTYDRIAYERDAGLVKLNPILIWHEREVWQYLALYRVPVNPLYAQGYRSLGCAPCSKIANGPNERAGRWIGTSKCGGECGIHTRPLKVGQTARAQASTGQRARSILTKTIEIV